MKRLEQLSCEKRIKELVLLSLEQRRLHRDLVNVYKHLMGAQ